MSVNNFSIMLGHFPVFLVEPVLHRIKCLAQGHNTVPPVSHELATLQSLPLHTSLCIIYNTQGIYSNLYILIMTMPRKSNSFLARGDLLSAANPCTQLGTLIRTNEMSPLAMQELPSDKKNHLLF